MRRVFIVSALFLICGITYPQIKDTVYFNQEGEVYIKELATIYRVANFDSINGHIIDHFEDFYLLSDSLIANGTVTYSEDFGSITDYKGSPDHFATAETMLELRASFIRIRDYPFLRDFILPNKSMEERTKMTHEGVEFVIVEDMASFDGGFEKMGWFISQFLQYPDEALKNNITGTVRVNFAIDVDGSITDIKIVKGIGYGCDKEVVRVMNLIPDWLPAIQHGKFVKTSYTLPIPFS